MRRNGRSEGDVADRGRPRRMACLAMAAVLTGLVACGSDGGPAERATGTADGTITTASAAGSSEPAPTAEAGDGKLCAVLTDERLTEVFVNRSVAQFAVEDVAFEPVPESEAPDLAAQLDGCAGRVVVSARGGFTLETVFVLGRSPYTGDASAPVAPLGGFPQTWTPIEGHAGMYEAGPLPFVAGGGVVVGDQVYLLLQAESHSKGGELVPVTGDEGERQQEQADMVAASREELDRDLVAALGAVADQAG